MSYADYMAERIRLSILQVLALAYRREMNSRSLATSLHAQDLKASLDQIRVQIAWLADNGLVESIDGDADMLARLTDRGLDVANGLASVPGIRRN